VGLYARQLAVNDGTAHSGRHEGTGTDFSGYLPDGRSFVRSDRNPYWALSHNFNFNSGAQQASKSRRQVCCRLVSSPSNFTRHRRCPREYSKGFSIRGYAAADRGRAEAKAEIAFQAMAAKALRPPPPLVLRLLKAVHEAMADSPAPQWIGVDTLQLRVDRIRLDQAIGLAATSGWLKTVSNYSSKTTEPVALSPFVGTD
jgi:hypothetical protein